MGEWVTVLLLSSSSSDFPQGKGHNTIAANLFQHHPAWLTCLPGTGHSGHTMRHPLPAHFYCHSPPGQHEDGREIPGGDRDTSWHSPSQHFNPRRGAPVLSSAETLTDELQCLATKQNLGKLVELLRCPDCPS